MDDVEYRGTFGPERKDYWMQTASGRRILIFNPSDPSNEFVIEDIAHHLSLVCRFTGAVRVHYSVAQHSVLVSQLVPPADALEGLLHDASEAYLNDIASPVKAGLPDYKAAEVAMERALATRFSIAFPKTDAVRRADGIAVATEARDLMTAAATLWRLPEKPLRGVTIEPWSPAQAERAFLDRFREITGAGR
jgi:hypothetical protein